MPSTRVRSLLLSPDLAREAKRLAKQEGRTETQVLREALRRYSKERPWRRLQRYGVSRVRKFGLNQADVDRSIQEFRRGR